MKNKLFFYPAKNAILEVEPVTKRVITSSGRYNPLLDYKITAPEPMLFLRTFFPSLNVLNLNLIPEKDIQELCVVSPSDLYEIDIKYGQARVINDEKKVLSELMSYYKGIPSEFERIEFSNIARLNPKEIGTSSWSKERLNKYSRQGFDYILNDINLELSKTDDPLICNNLKEALNLIEKFITSKKEKVADTYKSFNTVGTLFSAKVDDINIIPKDGIIYVEWGAKAITCKGNMAYLSGNVLYVDNKELKEGMIASFKILR